MSALIAALEAFDGKTVSVLSQARIRFQAQPDFHSTLVHLAASDVQHISEGATWLIKDILSSNGTLSARNTDALMGGISKITAWQAQLHICQSFAYLDVPSQHVDGVLSWLKPLLVAKRPFLRAWSMDALQHLAQHSELAKGQAHISLKRAQHDEAASVRARTRKWL